MAPGSSNDQLNDQLNPRKSPCLFCSSSVQEPINLAIHDQKGFSNQIVVLCHVLNLPPENFAEELTAAPICSECRSLIQSISQFPYPLQMLETKFEAEKKIILSRLKSQEDLNTLEKFPLLREFRRRVQRALGIVGPRIRRSQKPARGPNNVEAFQDFAGGNCSGNSEENHQDASSIPCFFCCDPVHYPYLKKGEGELLKTCMKVLCKVLGLSAQDFSEELSASPMCSNCKRIVRSVSSLQVTKTTMEGNFRSKDLILQHLRGPILEEASQAKRISMETAQERIKTVLDLRGRIRTALGIIGVIQEDKTLGWTVQRHKVVDLEQEVLVDLTTNLDEGPTPSKVRRSGRLSNISKKSLAEENVRKKKTTKRASVKTAQVEGDHQYCIPTSKYIPRGLFLQDFYIPLERLPIVVTKDPEDDRILNPQENQDLNNVWENVGMEVSIPLEDPLEEALLPLNIENDETDMIRIVPIEKLQELPLEEEEIEISGVGTVPSDLNQTELRDPVIPEDLQVFLKELFQCPHVHPSFGPCHMKFAREKGRDLHVQRFHSGAELEIIPILDVTREKESTGGKNPEVSALRISEKHNQASALPKTPRGKIWSDYFKQSRSKNNPDPGTFSRKRNKSSLLRPLPPLAFPELPDLLHRIPVFTRTGPFVWKESHAQRPGLWKSRKSAGKKLTPVIDLTEKAPQQSALKLDFERTRKKKGTDPTKRKRGGFLCRVTGCGEIFRRQSNLTAHLLSDAHQLSKCKLCRVLFQTKQELQEHESIHRSSSLEEVLRKVVKSISKSQEKMPGDKLGGTREGTSFVDGRKGKQKSVGELLHMQFVQCSCLTPDLKPCRRWFLSEELLKEHVKSFHSKKRPVIDLTEEKTSVIDLTEETEEVPRKEKSDYTGPEVPPDNAYPSNLTRVESPEVSKSETPAAGRKKLRTEQENCFLCSTKGCRKIFLEEAKFTAHRLTHCLQCEICGVGFASQSEFQSHATRHKSRTVPKTVEKTTVTAAPEPGKVSDENRAQDSVSFEFLDKFAPSSNTKKLENDQRFVEVPFSTFVCEVCLKKFSSEENLECHMRAHSAVKPLPCWAQGRSKAQDDAKD